MPKAEKGSVKDIAKRIKAKGLQKLKFYCQQCQKQCRDANGFKCHVQSDSHLQQMKIFSENAAGYMDRYSRDFELTFLNALRMRHGTTRVNANAVYQEVIRDRQHIHMNATIWATLTDFCKYLGKRGKCVVEETDRGWYVTYVEQDPDKLAREEAAERRSRAELAAETALSDRIERQRLEAAKAASRVTGGVVQNQATNLQRRDDDKDNGDTTKVALQVKKKVLTKQKDKKKKKKKNLDSVFGIDDDDDEDEEEEQPPSAPAVPPIPPPPPPPPPMESKPSSSLSKKRYYSEADRHNHNPRVSNTSESKRHRTDSQQQIRHNKEEDVCDHDDSDEDDDDSGNNSSTWLMEDILVRIVNRSVRDGRYFRRKAAVDRVLFSKRDDGSGGGAGGKGGGVSTTTVVVVAEVTVVSDGKDDDSGGRGCGSGDVLRLEEADLETVVPKRTGETVMVLAPRKYRGRRAAVLELDKKRYRAKLQLKRTGTVLDGVDYEDFSKMA